LHYSESETRYGDITGFTQRKMTNITEKKGKGYAVICHSSRAVTGAQAQSEPGAILSICFR
jgi:hypothetical protein